MNKHKKQKNKTIYCHELPQINSSDEKELWLPLLPIGEVRGRDGRKWQNFTAADTVKNTKLPFILDVDHQSELTNNTEASGWITELKTENNNIYGKLELTDIGQTAISNKRYKYYSPAFLVNEDGTVKAFTSVGLTNHPNLNVPALNHKTNHGEEMNEKIKKALDLDTEANEEAVLNAITQLRHKNRILKEASAPNMSEFVAINTHNQTVAELNTANLQIEKIIKKQHTEEVELELKNAIKNKKIAPADKDYYSAQCSTARGLEEFRKFISTKAEILTDTKESDFNKKAEDEKALNSVEKQMAEQLGVSTKDFIKAKKED